MNNALFKTKKFWEMYANYSITKAVSSCVISENAEDKEKADAFYKSGFAGQGYTRKQAGDNKKYFQKTFGVKFEITVEEDNLFD